MVMLDLACRQKMFDDDDVACSVSFALDCALSSVEAFPQHGVDRDGRKIHIPNGSLFHVVCYCFQVITIPGKVSV